MNALAELKNLPLSKAEQSNYAEMAINEILSGEVDPVEASIRLKAMLEVIKKIMDDDRVKSYTLDEAEKWGKSFVKSGVKVEISHRTTKDFTGCGDLLYNELLAEKTKLDAMIKAREAMLNGGVNPETGETFRPPATKTTTFLTYKF